LLHGIEGAREVGGSEVEGVGVGECLWHKAELRDVEIGESLAEFERGLAADVGELSGDATGELVDLLD